jgi:hypothetical protein
MIPLRSVYDRARRRWRRVLGIALGVVAVGVGGFFGYMELVKAGVLRYNKWDRRERGSLLVGAQAPDLEVVAYDGQPVRLSTFWTDRPLFLVFGSCT